MKRRVLLIGSGGTIASTKEGAAASTASLTAESLTRSIPETQSAQVTAVTEFSRINSWAIMQEDMTRLAQLVCVSAEDPAVDGIIVTHGTDTIERSAFLTDLLYSGDKPVVFVGAMRSADDPAPDGPGNLARVIEAIGSGVLDGLGVTVLVGVDIHAARSVTKIDSRQERAVVSPDFGPVAVRDASGVWARVRELSARCHISVPDGAVLPAIPILITQSVPMPGLLRFELDISDGRACVVEGLGSGNIPPQLAREVEAAAAAGVCVVLTTSALSGGVHPAYGGDGGGAELIDHGVRGARHLTSAKTAILLATLLAEAPDRLTERFDVALDLLLPLAQ